MSLKSICVFCGASPGARPVYHEAAETLGRSLAERGVTLIYGGGAVGLMGVVADAALDAKRDCLFIERLQQDSDHPVASFYPEGYYLKGLICKIY